MNICKVLVYHSRIKMHQFSSNNNFPLYSSSPRHPLNGFSESRKRALRRKEWRKGKTKIMYHFFNFAWENLTHYRLLGASLLCASRIKQSKIVLDENMKVGQFYSWKVDKQAFEFFFSILELLTELVFFFLAPVPFQWPSEEKYLTIWTLPRISLGKALELRDQKILCYQISRHVTSFYIKSKALP